MTNKSLNGKDLNNVTDVISDDVQLAARVAMGIGLYMLAMVTCVGNGMVIHAIRTEKRLRKVSAINSHFLFRFVIVGYLTPEGVLIINYTTSLPDDIICVILPPPYPHLVTWLSRQLDF